MSVVFTVGDPRLVTADQTTNNHMSRIASRMEVLLGNELFSDAVFAVGPDVNTAKRIPVHTFLLKTVSDAFAAMFSGNWKQDDVIHIPEHDESTVYSLLRWIYCDELVFESGNLVAVLSLANMYLVHSLITFVRDNFDNVEQEFAWSMFSFSSQLEDRGLYEKCLIMIKSRPSSHFASDDFLHAHVEGITEIISGGFDLDEMYIFERCLEWAGMECGRQERDKTPANKRSVMEPFIHQIAFPAMEASQFAGFPCESGVLTPEEQATILRMKLGIDLETGFRTEVRTAHSCPFWKPLTNVRTITCELCCSKVCLTCYRTFVTVSPIICDGQITKWKLLDDSIPSDECVGETVKHRHNCVFLPHQYEYDY